MREEDNSSQSQVVSSPTLIIKEREKKRIDTVLGQTVRLGRAHQVVIWREMNRNIHSKYQIKKKKSLIVSQCILKNFPFIKMSPFKYILHSLNRQGLRVKKQPARLTHQREEPSSNEIYIYIYIYRYIYRYRYMYKLFHREGNSHKE